MNVKHEPKYYLILFSSKIAFGLPIKGDEMALCIIVHFIGLLFLAQ
jgi:hypothetical protein